MGWAIGYDDTWKRDIGYGVVAYCDHPKCNETIDRGLSYVCCDEQPHGGEKGCGLYFCHKHVNWRGRCSPCRHGRKPYKAKPDHPKWMRWKLSHKSWQQWRIDNQSDVESMYRALGKTPPCRPFNLPHGSHDFTHGQCGRCGASRALSQRGVE